MSEETLSLHHGKHHRAYVDKLNELVPGTEFADASLEEIIARAEGPIFNQGAQAWNHAFFWNCLTPFRPSISETLRKALVRDFGDLERFQQSFEKAAASQFGSGWAWLAKDPRTGKLSILSTSNAGNPLRDGLIPLLTCDVWEHAYYVDYRNRRADFVKSFWNVANWEFVHRNLTEARRAEDLLRQHAA